MVGAGEIMKIPPSIKRCLKGFSLIYLSVCLGLYFAQERLIYTPTANHKHTPKSFGLRSEEVWIPVTDNAKIHGWWLQNPKAKKTILYLHGIGLNIGSNIEQAKHLYDQGFSVLLIDYRGYGKSDGPFPSEQRISEDVEAAWNAMVNSQQIKPRDIVLYGHSLGGAIAIDLATRYPEAGALIVQGSFTTMQDMAMLRQHNRLFPLSLLLHERYDSIHKVPKLRMPVLYIHGLEDSTIPARMSEALLARSPQPKKLFLVPNGTHENGDIFWEAGTAEVIKQFINSH
jgi:uncharacterized protein